MFGKYGNNFVKRILQLAEEKDSLNVATDQCSCPTGAADIARVLLELAEKIHNHEAHWGIYHYAGFPVVSRYEFVKKIMQLANNKIPINKVTTADLPLRAPRPQNSELGVQKIIDDYGIKRHEWTRYLQQAE